MLVTDAGAVLCWIGWFSLVRKGYGISHVQHAAASSHIRCGDPDLDTDSLDTARQPTQPSRCQSRSLSAAARINQQASG